MKKLLIVWFLLLTSNAMAFPIQIPSNDCTIHAIFTNTTEFNPSLSQIFPDNTISISGTGQTLENLEDNFDALENAVQVNNFRLRNPSCLIFHLCLSSFTKVLSAIQNSGHGTSEQAIFFVSRFGSRQMQVIPRHMDK